MGKTTSQHLVEDIETGRFPLLVNLKSQSTADVAKEILRSTT
jgi:hypothetical protein